MNETVKIIFGLLGGLAVFLYGMNMMSDNLQRAAGDRMKRILKVLTINPLMGVISGALVTAVLQSSSATTVMAIGFVSAGLMNLPQAISIIFGANIGTTMTAQLIAFKLSDYIWIIIFIGFIVMMLGKSRTAKAVGGTILGFGLLFLGIDTMGSVMKPLASSPVFASAIRKVANVPILGVLVGICMTLVVQSSSATIAVLQNIATQPGPDGVSSVIGLTGAIPVLLGDNIGTTITAILASLNQTRDAKRTAAAHCLFNVSGTLLFIWFIKPYARLIQYISPKGNEFEVISRQIANAHTGFNLTMTLIWLPLIGVMVKIVTKIIPDKEGQIRTVQQPMFLDSALIDQPIPALRLASREIVRCVEMVKKMLNGVAGLSGKNSDQQVELLQNVKGDADIEQRLSADINEYMDQVFTTGALSEKQASEATGILFILNEVDRVSVLCKDISDNIISVKYYSQEAMADLQSATDRILQMYTHSSEAVLEGVDPNLAELQAAKEEIDEINEELRKKHMERVSRGICSPKLTGPYNTLLHDLDRIGNCCVNLADMSRGEQKFSSYLKDVPGVSPGVSVAAVMEE